MPEPNPVPNQSPLAMPSNACLVGFKIAAKASKDGRKYSYYIAYGICSWFAMQISVNIAMNIGLMPIKGFTLPLISYGGSSMIFTSRATNNKKGALIRANRFLPRKPTALTLWSLILRLGTSVFSMPRFEPFHPWNDQQNPL
jgi:hypothetical protein